MKDYFADPHDVTLEYKKKAKSLPRSFVIAVLTWSTISVLTVVLGPAWQLFCSLVLVTVILGFGNGMAGKRKAIVAALSKGKIVRRLEMNDDVLRLCDVLECNPMVELNKISIPLNNLIDVRVARDWIGIYALDDEFCSIELRNDQFRDRQSRMAFIADVLRHIDATGSAGEHDKPYNPWIGKL